MNIPRPYHRRRARAGRSVIAALTAGLSALPMLVALPDPAAAAGSGVVDVEITPIDLATGDPVTDIGAGAPDAQVTYRVSYSCGSAPCEATTIAFSPSAPAPANPVQQVPDESLLRYQSFVQPPTGGVTAGGDDVTGRVFTIGDLAPGTSTNFSVTYAYARVRNREIAPGAWFADGAPIPMTATIDSPTATGPATSTADVTWHLSPPAGPTLSNPAFGTVEPDVPVTMRFGMNPGNFTSSNGAVQGIGTTAPAGSYEVVAHLPAEATITSADFGGVIDNSTHTVTWSAGTTASPSYAARGGWSTLAGNGTTGLNNGIVPDGDAFWSQRSVEVVFPASSFPEADAEGCNFSKDLTTTLDVAVSYLDAAHTEQSATRSGTTRVACATPFGGMPTPAKGVAGGGFQASVGNGTVDTAGPGGADDVYAVNVPPPGETDPSNRSWRVSVQNTGNVAATAVVDEPDLDQDHVKVHQIAVIPYQGAPADWAGTVTWTDSAGDSATSPIAAGQPLDAAPGRWFVSARTELPIAAGRVLRTDGTATQVSVDHRFKVLDGAAGHIGERRTNTAEVSLTYPADADGDGIDDDYTDTAGAPLPTRSFSQQVSRTVQYTEPLGTLAPGFTAITVDGGGQVFPGTNVTFGVRASTNHVWPGTSILPQLVFIAPAGWHVVPGSAAITANGTGWADPAPAGVTFDYATKSIAGVDRELVVATWPNAVTLSSAVDEAWPTLSVKATPTNTAAVGVGSIAHVWAGDQSGNWSDATSAIFRQGANEFNADNMVTDTTDVDGDGNTTEDLAANFNGSVIVAATDSVTAVKELCLPDPAAADGCQWVSDPAQPGEIQADTTDITYRIRIINSGNTTLNGVVAYDVLPFVGDTGLLPGGAPRGSQFALTLGGIDSASPGVTVAGSGSTNPARPQVNPGASGTVDDWGPVAAGDRALRITVDGGLAPAEERVVTFHAALPSGVTAGQQACNSAAVDSANTLPAEPASVCVVLTAVPNPPPTVAITAPADGATFEYGDDVDVDFSCSDVPTTDLVSCVADDDGDAIADGDPVPTTAPGTHTLTVTATDSAGQTATETVTYTVNRRPNQPPTATITTPAAGAVYFVGQVVRADYTCADPDGTVVSCTGPVAAGADIDTATAGPKTFTVTATDDEGATGTASTSYTVVAVAGVCRGTPLSLLGLIPGTANARTSPCVNDDARILGAGVTITPAIPLLRIPANAVSVGVITSGTRSGAGSASAHAEIASVSINLLGTSIVATGLTSMASSTLSSCSAPAALKALSTITSLTINGKPVANLDGPVTVPLLIGSLALNERIVSGNTITQNALHLNVLGLVDLVLGQSVAGATC